MALYSFDVDDTLIDKDGKPTVLCEVVEALRADGQAVWAISGNPLAADLLAKAGVSVDRVVVTPPGDLGQAKATFLKANGAVLHVDNKASFVPAFNAAHIPILIVAADDA